MKKLFLLMSMAATMFAFAGCQKNEVEGPNTIEGGSTFELVAEIAQTKTTLDVDTYKVEWESDDVIYMVTDGEGTPWSTATSFKYADGKFKTESQLAAGTYEMNALYAVDTQAQFHKNTGTTHKLQSTQSQDCVNPTAHIKDNDALVGTFTANVPMTEAAAVNMNHIYTLMQVDVKNNTGAEINISKFEMKVPSVALAGIFTVDFAEAGVEIQSGSSETITVNVENGTVADRASLPIYFVAAPFTSDVENGIEFKVTTESGATYTKTANKALTFEAGEYNTTPYTLTEADVEPEQPGETTVYYEKVTSAPADWSGKYLIVYEEDADAYVFNGQDAVNGYVSATITGNQIEANDELDAVAVTIEPMTGGYAIKTVNGYIYGNSSSNKLSFATSAQLNTIDYSDEGVKVTSGRDLRFNAASNQMRFRYYSTGSQKPIQLYRLSGSESGGNEGGETPEEPTTPVITVTDSPKDAITADGDIVTIQYSVTNPVDGTSVSATTDAEWITDFDYTIAGEVTFIVAENAGAERSAIVTLAYERAESVKVTITQARSQSVTLPEGITSIKALATSTNEADFAVTLTDAVVTYVSGSNAYIEDAEAGILIYKNGHGLKIGDKLSGEVSGKVKLYSNLREITSIDYSKASMTSGAEVPVTMLTLDQLNAEGAYDKYENMRIKIVDATVSAEKQISQNDQTYDLYFKNNSVTGFDVNNIIDVIGYPSKYDSNIQLNVWENAVIKKVAETTINVESDLSVKVGETKKINASASSGEEVSYLSADPTIATVDENGNVTGVAEGTTTIKVSVPANDVYPAAEKICNVTVTAESQGGGDEPVEKAWRLVTDASTLAAGDEIVIVAKNANFAMSTTQNTNNRAQAAVTKNDDNTVTFGSDVQVLTLEAGKSSGTFAFNTGSGYLYAASSSKNYLKTEKTLTANSSWNITITAAGVATIKATGSYTRNWIRYNSSNNPPLFSCYSSGQADVCIYKFQ